MVVTCNSFGVSGMDGYKVELEASMYNGTREFDMVGLPDAAVRESKDRVLSALKNCGFISCRTYDREPCPCRYQKRRAYLRFADCGCNSYTAQSD